MGYGDISIIQEKIGGFEDSQFLLCGEFEVLVNNNNSNNNRRIYYCLLMKEFFNFGWIYLYVYSTEKLYIVI